MRPVLCALTALTCLSACGPRVVNEAAKVAAAVAAPPQTVRQPAVANMPDPFGGQWQVAGEEGPNKGELKITPVGDDYQISYGVGSPGCGGQVDGAAKPEGAVIHFKARLKEVEDICEIDITRHPDGHLTIEEQSEGCRSFHGAQCDFDGTAVRKPAGVTSARN